MLITKNKISFITDLEWTTKGLVNDEIVNTYLSEKGSPYYVVIDNGDVGGIIGYVSSGSKIVKKYSAASFAIDNLREKVDDSFILIHEIDPGSKNYYVLYYSVGQIEYDSVHNVITIRSLMDDVGDETRIYISNDFIKYMDSDADFEIFDFFETANGAVDVKHKLKALSEVYNNIKDAIKWFVVLAGLVYLALFVNENYFEKEKSYKGPSSAEMLAAKAKKDRKEQEEYIAEQLKKRTGGISPVIAYNICNHLINEMPVNVGGWKKGSYGCKRSNDFNQNIVASTLTLTRVRYSAKPKVFKQQVIKKGFTSSVMFDQNRNVFSAVVLNNNKTSFEKRPYLIHEDLTDYNIVMNAINVSLINGIDSSCSVKRIKRELGPLSPDKPIPTDLKVHITDIDISCNKIYLEQLRNQLDVLNRKDINFVYFNLLENKFTTKYQFISKN